MKRLITLSLLLVFSISACTGQPVESEYLETGKAAFANHEYSLALQQFKLAIEEQPGNPEGYSLAADILLRKHNYQEVVSLLEQGIMRIDNPADLAVPLAEAYRNLGEYESAVTHYKTGLDVDPGNVTAWEGLVRSLGATGNTDELKAVVANLPDNDPVHQLVKTFVLRDQEDAASMLDGIEATGTTGDLVEQMQTILSEELTNFSKTELAYIMLQAGYPEIIRDVVNEVIADNEFYETPYLYRGAALVSINMPVRAIDNFRKVLELDPDNIDAKILLAQSLYEQDTHEQATDYLRGLDILSLSSDQQEYVLSLLTEYKRFPLASSYIAALEGTEAGLSDDLVLLALQISVENAEFEKADNYSAQLLENADDNAQYLAWAGYVALKEDDKGKAEELFTLAKSADRTNPRIYLFEAELAISNEDYGAAQELLDRAVDLDLNGEITPKATSLRSQL